MCLFFNDCSINKSYFGTNSWQSIKSIPKIAYSYQFKLFQQTTMSSIKQLSMLFYLDHENIYLSYNNIAKKLPLCLTAMEQSFYLKQQQIFAFKLIRNHQTTILYTYSQQDFIQIYCLLAQHCILNNFFKHFKVLQKIGYGSFSKVYQGYNILSNNVVALKVFNKQHLQTIEDGQLYLRNEIQKLQTLKKYHLSPLIQIYETIDCIILVLEKAQAGNMLDWLDTQKQNYNEQMIQSMMGKIIENLNQLHKAGFIHRDIKPQNILFLSNNANTSLFLSDFGLTIEKSAANSKFGRKCSGTLGFVAPQILCHHNYNQKCDIFSLGCLFYFLETGLNLINIIASTQDTNQTTSIDFTGIRLKIKSIKNINLITKDLLLRMLELKPSKRISMEQILKHEYFGGKTYCKSTIDGIDNTFRDYIQNKIEKFWKNI